MAEAHVKRYRDRGVVAAWVVAMIYGLLFSLLAVLRHTAFNTHAFDLGLFHQVTWNIHSGEGFRFTYWLGLNPLLNNYLGDHVSLVLWPLSWLYWIHSGPETLLVVQAFLVGSGVVPLYLLGRHWGARPLVALGMASLYLAHPALQGALLFDFHPDVLSAPLLLWAFYSALRRSYTGFWTALVLALMTKENVALIVVAFGVYLAFQRTRRSMGIATSVIGILWFGLCFFLILPRFNPGTGSNYVVRYSAYGGSWSEIVLAFLTRPGSLWRVLVDPSTVAYSNALWMPYGFMSFLAPEVLAIARTITYHYSVIIAAVSALAAVRGATRTATWLEARSVGQDRVARALCGLAVICTVRFQVSQYGTIRFWGPEYRDTYRVSEHDRIGVRFLEQVPAGAPVSAQSDIAPHISERRAIYVFPTVNDAEYVLLDATSTIFPVHLFPIEGLTPEAAYVEY
ncbi:MAG: DUF2079 domain-containing protein, partial [Anaerolineae bacterium]|nr:DUF2079 domain-containing protein [Anaerolineae bacterium]